MSKAARLPLVLSVFACLLTAWQAGPALAEGTGGYRGPQRNGVFPAENILENWPEGGPKLLWKVTELGRGFSSPTVANGMVYCQGMMDGNKGYLFAYTLDGKQVFKEYYGPDFTASGRFQGPRGTPSVTDKHVVVASGCKATRYIACHDAKTGKQLWAVDLNKRHGGKSQGWGYNESPMIHNGKVLVTLRSKDKVCPPVVALDINTGETVWQADPEEGDLSAGDDSVVVFDAGKRHVAVVPLWRAILALDPDTGKRIWKISCDKAGNSPVYRDGYLFCQNGLKNRKKDGSMVLRIAPDGSYTKLWDRAGINPGLAKSVIADDKVFLFGRDGKQSVMMALDVQTGKTVATHPCTEPGSVIAAGARVIFLEGGERKWKQSRLTLVKPTKEGFEVVSQFTPEIGTLENWVHPVVAEGRLWIRHGNMLAAYDLRKDSAAD